LKFFGLLLRSLEFSNIIKKKETKIIISTSAKKI